MAFSKSVSSKGDAVYGKDDSYFQNEKHIHVFLYSVMENLLKRECRGKRVLDIGCGPGQWCRMAAECGAKSVNGFDIQEKMVETAKLATSKFATVNIRVGDASDMPYDNNTFDMAFSIFVTCSLSKDVLSKHYQDYYSVCLCQVGKLFWLTCQTQFINKYMCQMKWTVLIWKRKSTKF